MGIFERYLSVWVGLSILCGAALGLWQPDIFQIIVKIEVAHVNLIVAMFIWIMIYPMMVQIDFSSIKNIRET
ncbi:MAG: arsenical-resistance protein, partial [Deltaproteobacteria bacterium]|nr:arsenical-resistance protein [Deltaproteobacteria bacterium]